MQCDVIKYKEIKKKAEDLGAEFSTEFNSEKSSEFSLEEQNAIRENHHYLSAAWIAVSRNNLAEISSLDSAAKRVPDDLVDDLMNVCMYHCKLPINDCIEESKITGARIRLISAILRLADELDITKNRVSMDAYDTFRMPPDNYIYWWLHDHTKIRFLDGSNNIVINMNLNPEDAALYGTPIKELYIDELKTKNQPVINVLVKNNIAVCIDDESGIIENAYTERMPVEVRQQVIENAIRQKDSCQVLKIGERFTGRIHKFILRFNKFAEYILLESDFDNKIYLPYSEKIYSVFDPIPRKVVSILRTKNGYRIEVGPRVLDIGERIEGKFHYAKHIDDDLSLVLIGNHEIKVPKDVAHQALTIFLAKNDFISISRNGAGYDVTSIKL